MKKIISYICLITMLFSVFAYYPAYAQVDTKPLSTEYPTNKYNDVSYTGTDKISDAMSSSQGNNLYATCVQLVGGTGYIDYVVNIEEPADFMFSVCTGSQVDDSKIDVFVNDLTKPVFDDAPIENTGNMEVRKYGAPLGIISLKDGENTIRIRNLSSYYIQISSFKLTLISEDENILSDTMEFTTNKNTDTAKMSGVISEKLDGAVRLASLDGYVDYIIKTQKESEYVLYVSTGSASDDGKIDVFVNDISSPMFNDVKINNTGNINVREYGSPVGIITLTPGSNNIRIQNASGQAIDVAKFKISKFSEDITANPIEFTTNKNTDKAKISGKVTSWYGGAVLLFANDYVDYVINTKTALDYDLSICTGAAADNLKIDVFVNDMKTPVFDDEVIANTNKTYIREYGKSLGSISLSAGMNTIRIQNVSSDYIELASFKLCYLTEDIVDLPIEFETNKNTDTSKMTGVISNKYGGGIELAPEGYVDYTVNTINEANYILSVSTGAGSDGCKIDVFVNGLTTPVFDDSLIENTGSNATRKYGAPLGSITLTPGPNTIRIKNVSSSYIEVSAFKLAPKTEDIIKLPIEFSINKDTIAGTNVSQDALYPSCVALKAGEYVEYTLKTEKNAVYPFYVYLCTADDNLKMDVAVNGELQLKDTSVLNNGSFATADYSKLGDITFASGENVIRLTNTSADNAIVVRGLKIGADDEEIYDESQEFSVELFQLQTEQGVRVPYVIVDGNDVYATLEFKKVAKNDTDDLRLFVAQYSADNILKSVNFENIDTSSMSYLESKKVQAKLTLKGDTGSVKAYLMKKGNLSPVSDKIGFTESTIFSKDYLETLFNETPSYTLATELKDSNGVYYKDFSEHNDKYDIDAIFYDSPVGKQTKVFAYLGIPKGASKDNPVPAIVCIHGGSGVAYIDWVKKWNDRGVAAIAMSMNGDGPGAQVEGDSPHPYRGLTCWGEHIAFRKDFESASMYQNVQNVIRAHNLLRSLDAVDETKTAITGISWGGITTTTTAGLDNRFKFAMPCYGCGYLEESRTVFYDSFEGEDRSVAWDPANFAAQSQIPFLYINGDSDDYFSLNITTHTKNVTKDAKLSIHHGLIHGNEPIWGLSTIYDYALNMFEGKDPLIEISNENAQDGKFTANYTAPEGTSLNSVTLYYITSLDLGFAGTVQWQSVQGTFNGSQIMADIPLGATHCYVTTVDNKGSIVSSRYLDVK